MTRPVPRHLISDSAPPSGFRLNRLRFPLAAVVACVAVTVADSCEAWGQFYGGPRGRGAIVVAPPIVPMPYLDDPFYGRGFFPPPFWEPPSGVRIRTPLFSLNIGPGGQLPPRGHYDRYEAYRPHNGYGRPHRPLPPASAHRYRPGADGGIPEITSWPVAPAPSETASGFSRGQLRRSASMLRAALSVRGEEGEIWLDYLQPDAVVAAAEGRFFEFNLTEMAQRYEGVMTNPDLGHIRTLPGFETTKDLLALWARQVELNAAQSSLQGQPPSLQGQSPVDSADVDNPPGEAQPEMPRRDNADPPVETLPAPLPQAAPEQELAPRAEPL
jgi:hypothetical protein